MPIFKTEHCTPPPDVKQGVGIVLAGAFTISLIVLILVKTLG